MAVNLEGLLLKDQWAPITSEMGFLEAEVAHAAGSFAAWQGGLNAPRGIAVGLHPVSGTLEQVLSTLLPLTFPETRRDLFIPTRSPWTAYVENGKSGTDAASAMSYMARTIGCRGLRVVAVPNEHRKGKGRFGAVMLEVYGPHRTAWINTIRAVAASNDGGRWAFDAYGEPFPFEKLDRYQERRVQDRFTFDMLKEYLRYLGLTPFEESFYLPEGAPAWLVERTGPVAPNYQEFTLAEARKNF
jgi:hypothetical protein